MRLTKQEIPTPALLLDLDLFEANLARMAQAAATAGKNLRPHVKAHKCVEIAKRQIAAGAVGICAATVDEVEMLARAGIEGILLTSPVADPAKMRRVVAAGAMVAVDHVQQVDWYRQAAEEAKRRLSVVVDLDIGDHRTGAGSVEAAIGLAIHIDRGRHLWLRGVQAYSVSGSHGATFEIRAANSAHTFAQAAAVRDGMARHGLHSDLVTGGSTGTWDIDLAIAHVTELQAGSYPLMDIAYRNIGAGFANAMTILATVISANHKGFVTIDAGFKAFSTDRPFGPEPVDAECGYRWGGDEFGYLDGARAGLGDRVELLPPHCDPTANLHNRIYACRGNEVEAIWNTKE